MRTAGVRQTPGRNARHRSRRRWWRDFHLSGAVNDRRASRSHCTTAARDKDAALECILRNLALPRDRCQQRCCEKSGRVPVFSKRKAPGAVGILGHTGGKAGLPKERRLLVTGDAREWHCATRQIRSEVGRPLARTWE